MTTKQAIDELSKLPEDAVIGSYNPCLAETIYLEKFELKDGFIQLLFEEETKTGHPFAPL